MDGFVTKDSGQRQQFASGMVRDVTTGKVDYTFILQGPMFARMIRERARSSILPAFLAWFRGDPDADYAAMTLDAIDVAESGQMFERWSQLMERGAIKYERDNWMKAEGEAEYVRFKQSALRHLMQYLRGDRDEDHAAAVFFNINGAEYVKGKMQVAA